MIDWAIGAREADFCSKKQMRAILKFVNERGGIAWWKVGEGKTRIAIFTFARLQAIFKWESPVCLVVCRRGAFYDWRQEILHCFPDSRVYENEIPPLPPGNQLNFLLVSHGCMSLHTYRKVKGKKFKQRVENENFHGLNDNQLIRFVALDELWLYSNHKSARSKAARLLNKSRIPVGLSGTVMKARNIEEIHAQAKVVRKEKYLASSLTKFRSLHWITKKIELSSGLKIPGRRPKRGAYKAIMKAAADFADVNFPKGKRVITEQFHNIKATPKQLEYFQQLKDYYEITDLGIEYDQAITIGIKAQQIANGWLKTPDGDIVRVPTNKIEKLSDELSDILSAGERAVVWCAFRRDVEILARELEVASVQMVGGKDFDVDKWLSGRARLCLATEASGSSVNHLANAPFAIYFSATHKWLDMQQSRGRTDRGKASSHRECFYKYLQVDGSVDSHVYQSALASGRAESKLILAAEINNWLKTK